MVRSSRQLAVAFLLTVGAALLFSHGTIAQQQQPFDTDHFLCYEAIDRNPNAPITISLDDQFGTLNVSAMTALEFCNPTSKRTTSGVFTPIEEPDAHLTFYELTQKLRSVRRTVSVTNQFGTQTLRVAAPRMVAVPTLKNDEGTERDLDDLNHFTCYEASGKRLLEEVDVHDQFLFGQIPPLPEQTILIHAPHFLCNPATKTRDTEESPVPDEDEHLVCYKVTPSENPPVASVRVENQFEGFATTALEVFDIGPLHFLCVPSTKQLLP